MIKMKKIFKITGIIWLALLIVAIVAVFWISGYPVNYYHNNAHIEKLASELDDIPATANTEKFGTQLKEFGNLAPAGNSCSFHVANLIKSKLSEGELSTYYNSFVFNPLNVKNVDRFRNDGGSDSEVKIKLIQIDHPSDLRNYTGLNSSEKWVKENEAEIAKLADGDYKAYLLDVFDGIYAPNELRCH